MKLYGKNVITSEIKGMYINSKNELYCQHNFSAIPSKPTELYHVGDKIKLVCHSYLISGTVSGISSRGIFLYDWHIGEDR